MFRKQFLFLLLVFVTQHCIAQELLRDEATGLSYLMRRGQPTGDLVILIHGYGSNEEDLMSLARNFPVHTNVICPRGSQTYGPGKYSWYDITFKQDGNHQRNKEQATKSSNDIAAFTNSMRDLHTTKTGKIIVGGFSQGAILSVALALQHPEIADGIMAFSGTMLHEDLVHDPTKAKLYARVNVFYAHGTADTVLPIMHGRICKERLENAGVQLTYKEYKMDHTIIPAELGDAIKWYTSSF